MNALIPYLVFPGTCKEAMTFYQKCLGGEITSMQTFGDSPVEVPTASSNRIFNSELKAGSICIKASDDLPGHDVKLGNQISLYAVFPDSSSKEKAFTNLSEGGKVLFPLDDHFGMLKDKYGIQWMFVHE